MKKPSIAGRHRRQQHPELFWPRVVVRKLLNIAANNSDYSADSDSGSDSDQEYCDWPKESRFKERTDELQIDANAMQLIPEALPKLRRRNSETFRSQYINSKKIRICAATWNVGGKVPSDDLDLDEWLDVTEPADLYVIGLQEIIPLNAGNIFGAEDSRPVSKWENIIREKLNRIPPTVKFKCYSDPSSPSRFRPSEDAPDIDDEIVLESDSEGEDEIFPLHEEPNNLDEIEFENLGQENLVDENEQQRFNSPKRLNRLDCFKTDEAEENAEPTTTHCVKKFTKTLSSTERISLSWPEVPLDLLAQHGSERPNSFKSTKSFTSSKSFRTYSSFKISGNCENTMQSDIASLAEVDLESLISRKRRPPYVRILSKQMVGILITIWVRRSLRRHIQNLNVSTVGVGAMGYIGNKGSISVSMSIYQTLCCFVCTHLSSGAKDGDAAKRSGDVHEIHRRTRFNSHSAIGLPKSIYDHERIIWLGDLNYRINLSYAKTRELISKKDWSNLINYDQLMSEFRKGGAFDGWSEGTLNFAPTYKYETNSESYIGEEPKAGRRTPAWCDRIISCGTGMKLLRYKRTELMLSDHRPVSASYMVDVEEFSSRKLQRALTLTNAEIALTLTTAEIEEQDMATDFGIGHGLSLLRSGEDPSYLER